MKTRILPGLACVLLLSPLAVAGTVLENPQWRIELDAATLAMRVTPAGREPVQASSGVAICSPAHTIGLSRRTPA